VVQTVEVPNHTDRAGDMHKTLLPKLLACLIKTILFPPVRSSVNICVLNCKLKNPYSESGYLFFLPPL